MIPGRIHPRLQAARGGAPRVHQHRALLSTIGFCLFLACGSPLLSPAAPIAASTTQRVLASGVVFPGPARGVPGNQKPVSADYKMHCNAGPNTYGGMVGGATVVTGTAVQAVEGCGIADLPLIVTGNGQYHATFGVSDADTTGKSAEVRVYTIDQDGFPLSVTRVVATHGAPASIDVDLTGAVAIQLAFISNPTTFVYNARLTGSARTVAAASGSGSTIPSGATPIDMAAAAYGCNASKPSSSTVLSATLVGLATTGSAQGTGCGTILLSVPASAHGTMVLRYGADDISTLGVATLSMRALDAAGRLLRKSTGTVSVGTGLQALWVDLAGARTVQLTFDGGTDVRTDVTAVATIPSHIAPYVTRDRVIRGTAAGAVVNPAAFANSCNSGIGTDDLMVAHHLVLAGSSLSTYGCGAASLFFCCTGAVPGTFRATFGVNDTASASGKAQATITVKDKDNHILSKKTVSVAYGSTARLSVDVSKASVVSFAFEGTSGVLYDMRLTGRKVIAQQLYAPSTPSVAVPGGVAVNPHDFAVHCNAEVITTDKRVVGATALEGWALSGNGCGEADLTLKGTPYPGHNFYARAGIPLNDPPSMVTVVTFNVLSASGKIVRSAKIDTRYGYGTQLVHLSLAGGATVQILWNNDSIVYGMTAS